MKDSSQQTQLQQTELRQTFWLVNNSALLDMLGVAEHDSRPETVKGVGRRNRESQATDRR
jgi:hypothetical protein